MCSRVDLNTFDLVSQRDVIKSVRAFLTTRAVVIVVVGVVLIVIRLLMMKSAPVFSE